jgi:hypothetical protein
MTNSIIISVVSVYFAMIAVFAAFYILRRERRQQSDNYLPEINRLFENADTLNSLGWHAAAVIIAYSALEQTMNAVAKKRMISEVNSALPLLVQKLIDEHLIDSEEEENIQNVIYIRNLIIHGKTESVTKRKLLKSYESSIRISKILLRNI